MAVSLNPPRNGEGERPKGGGGAGVIRTRHRTLGATNANIQRARDLRRQLSLPEVILWRELRKRPQGFRFRRQFPNRGYVVDFACLGRRLAIEIDGEAHSMGRRPQRDMTRDAALAKLGFTTMRIAARDVLDDLQAVLTLILSTCANRPLHHPADGPPPRSGEE
ncbi:MAG: endonuclease domain-containing protein [Sphingomicrobium sp.]